MIPENSGLAEYITKINFVESDEGRVIGETKEATDQSGEAVRPTGLHEITPYRPIELDPILRKIASESSSLSGLLEQGTLTSQLKGRIAEVSMEKPLSEFGRLETLPVQREAGSFTADNKLHLERPLLGFRTGQTIIVEIKHGDAPYIANQLRNADSHARNQLRDTIAREGADGGVCLVPREVQNHPSTAASIRASLEAEPGPRMKVWMGLPHEGAMRAAVERFRSAGS